MGVCSAASLESSEASSAVSWSVALRLLVEVLVLSFWTLVWYEVRGLSFDAVGFRSLGVWVDCESIAFVFLL